MYTFFYYSKNDKCSVLYSIKLCHANSFLKLVYTTNTSVFIIPLNSCCQIWHNYTIISEIHGCNEQNIMENNKTIIG